MKNYYHILGLSFESSPEKQLIEAAYKALVKLYHPDVYNGDKKSLNRKISEINESYETLRNEAKKKVYDEKLKNYHMSKSFDYSDQEFEDKDIFNKVYSENDLYKEIKIFQTENKFENNESKLQVLREAFGYIDGNNSQRMYETMLEYIKN